MNLVEATKRACEEDTLLDALTFICVWESERLVKQVKSIEPHDSWDTCFGISLKSVMEAYK